jgi:AcrR family transcriptional regulator
VTTAPPTPVPAGRVPVQPRAVARVEGLLTAAGELLAADPERLTMTAVADRAGVSIGSLYQYFPARSSLVRALAERHLLAGHVRLMKDLGAPAASPSVSLERALRHYLELADDGLAVAIMTTIRADPGLRALDRTDTRVNAKLALTHLGLPATDPHLTAMALVIDLAGHLIIDLATEPASARPAKTEAFVRLARRAVG